MINKEFLRYLDLFGTKCSFYTEQKLKLYTPLGGILSIASIGCAIFIFIYINLSSFKKEDPELITRSIIEEDHIIKFSEEKIWIPWKITNSDENFFNHTGVLYPIIKYYYKDNNTQRLESKNLSYKICNETSMVNKADNIIIDSSIDTLYCIDMDDLFMGGSFSSQFLYYIEFNLYICKDGVDFEKNNTDCLSNEKLNYFNDYLQIIFYYPILQFQEVDYKSPIKIKYYKNCVFLNKYMTKIDQLFLKKIVLYDKYRLFDSTMKIYNYWGYSYINRDFNFIHSEENKTSSKLYTFNIFIESNTIYYYRKYKNIFIILAQSLPLIELVHNILKLIAKVFKLSSINRKMTELLFENLTEKQSKYDNYVEEIKNKNMKDLNNMIRNSEEKNMITKKDNLKKNKNSSSIALIKKKEKDRSAMSQLSRKVNNSPKLRNEIQSNNNSNYSNNFSNNFSNNNNCYLKDRINSFNFNNIVVYKKLSLNFEEPQYPKKKRFVANKLFPFRYYFCSIFVKNIDISKHRFCLSWKFIKVYCFLCQLFDISSYCVLQKEFNIVKRFLFDEKNIELIEQNTKINVNSQSFMNDMNHCIGSNKFHILGKNNIKKSNKKIFTH
jgi:hypothetical protein